MDTAVLCCCTIRRAEPPDQTLTRLEAVHKTADLDGCFFKTPVDSLLSRAARIGAYRNRSMNSPDGPLRVFVWRSRSSLLAPSDASCQLGTDVVECQRTHGDAASYLRPNGRRRECSTPCLIRRHAVRGPGPGAQMGRRQRRWRVRPAPSAKAASMVPAYQLCTGPFGTVRRGVLSVDFRGSGCSRTSADDDN